MIDDHVQHTWHLTHADGGEVRIDLWTDGETVRVDGGDGESSDGGRAAVEQLLAKYAARGYQVESSYPVNEPEQPVNEPEQPVDEPAGGEPDGRPEACPECTSPVEYAANHVGDFREGEAWLCTGCKWGQWITA